MQTKPEKHQKWQNRYDSYKPLANSYMHEPNVVSPKIKRLKAP